MTRPVDTELREWVERLSMLLERDGLPRMAGRIFGWLLVCDPPEQSMEELAAAVQGSKASMSTMTRLLVQSVLVEKVRHPGARRDVFRIRPGQWRQLWRARVQMLNEATDLTARGVELLEGRSPEVRARLEELHHQYRFIGQHLPTLLEQLDRERPLQEEGRAAVRRAKGAGRRGG
jgi:DNA-binding transcriptional regulator GbsR (MarR family)